MNYLVTDNTAGALRLEESPEIAYADFYDLLDG